MSGGMYTEHRAVPLEVLREFTRSVAEMSSIRHVAEDAGVGRSTVHQFIAAGTTPHPRVRRLLALWYLRRVAGVDELELIRPYASALDVLLGDVPEPLLQTVTLNVLRNIGEVFPPDGEQEAPRWLEAVRRRRVGWVLGDT
jgi:hypothetical protein